MAHTGYSIHINILHGKWRTEEASQTVKMTTELHSALSDI